MNWYKLAKNEIFLQNERQLAEYLKQHDFIFSYHGGRHHVYCHKRRPEFKIFVSPHTGSGYSKSYVEKVKRDMFGALDEIDKKDQESKAKEVSQQSKNHNQEDWKNSPWYKQQLEYSKS